MQLKLTPICYAVLAVISTLTNANESENEAEIAQLETIDVVAEVNSYNNSPQTIYQKEIKRQPQSNGTINGLLRKNGAIRYSNNTNQSTQGGEIEPELVSFHGEPYYNNLFLIDGFSNNNIINPGASNGGFNSVENNFETGMNLYLAPSTPESFQIDNSLLNKVNIYDSNVPAKYTDFTGGVINAELKDADPSKSSGRISYRTTRDRWTNFHFSDEEQENVNFNDALNNIQPEFKKHIYNLSINQPLSDKTALLFSYNRTQSFIPENHWLLGQRQIEKRLAETYLLKGTHHLRENHILNASVIYSPNKNTYFADNVKNGRYTNNGGGYRIAFSSDFVSEKLGRVKSSLDYADQQNRVKYDTQDPRYTWIGNIPNTQLTWCSATLIEQSTQTPYCTFSREGGLGELSSQTKTWTAKQDYEILPFETDVGTHQLDLGWSVSFAQAISKRPNDAKFFYNSAWFNQGRQVSIRDRWINGKIPMEADCIDCLLNEQYQTILLRYPHYKAKANVNHYSFYIDDDWQWQRWQSNLGFNITYDSFLKNLNIAPRFAFNFNVIDENKFSISGGLNRYYAGNILANALRSQIPADEQYSRQLGNATYELMDYNRWISYHNVRNLKTPYSDEANIGLSTQVLDQLLSLKYVHRAGKKQFNTAIDSNVVRTLPTGKTVKTYVMNNDGKSRSDSVTLGLRNLYPFNIGMLELGYQFGVNIQKSRTNSLTGYLASSDNTADSSVSDDTQTRGKYYIYNEQRYDSFDDMRDFLPALNFNARWNAFLEINTDLPKYGFKWTHYLNFFPGYTAYGFKQGICGETIISSACEAEGDRASIFQTKKYKKAFTLDWNFLYEIPVYRGSRLELSLDVMNVLNAKIATSSSNAKLLESGVALNHSYRLGRQYWLGIAYHW